MPSFFNIVHVSSSESQLPASKCCYLVQNIKHRKKNSTNHHTRVYQRRKEKHQHASEKNSIHSNNFQTPSATTPTISIIVIVTATRLILSSLRLESPQHISRFKLLCCHHGNYYISRTLDLCSLVPGGYCTTQASFARARTIHHTHPSHIHTQAHTHTKTHYTLSHTLPHTYTHKHTVTKTHTLHCGTWWSTFESDRRTLARSG